MTITNAICSSFPRICEVTSWAIKRRTNCYLLLSITSKFQTCSASWHLKKDGLHLHCRLHTPAILYQCPCHDVLDCSRVDDSRASFSETICLTLLGQLKLHIFFQIRSSCCRLPPCVARQSWLLINSSQQTLYALRTLNFPCLSKCHASILLLTVLKYQF